MTKTQALNQARARVTALRRFGRQWVFSSNCDGKGWRESLPRDFFTARADRSEMIREIAADLMAKAGNEEN